MGYFDRVGAWVIRCRGSAGLGDVGRSLERGVVPPGGVAAGGPCGLGIDAETFAGCCVALWLLRAGSFSPCLI